MLPRRRASAAQSKDLSSSDVPFTMPGPTSDQQYGHYSHDYAAEPTYAEFLSSGDDWLDPYSLSPSESSSSQRRKRSTTCDIKSDSSTVVYATPLRPRARSLRDASRKPASGTTSLLSDDTRQGHPSKEKAPTKHSLHHLPRARSRILKSPPPPPVLELDQQPPSLPNVDVQQIKDELSGDCDQKPQALPRRQKSLQHHYQQLQLQQQYELPSKETASVISNVKRKFSLKDRAATSHDHFNTTFARNPTSNGVDSVGRKSRTPSRSSLADYSGSRSSSARRRSVYSSPPPPSRSHGRSNSRQHQKKDDGGWTTSDEEGGRSSTASNSSTSLMGHYDDGFIPPVPPVPKHHSIKTPIHSINDDVPAGLDTAPSQKSSRGTFGSFEEIINAQKTSQGDGGAHHGLLAADMEGKPWDSREIGTVRTSPRVSSRTSKKQHEQHKSMEQDAQNYYAKSSPSLLPRRTSSRKHQHKTSPKMTSLQKPDDGKKVANRKRGRTLPGSLATPPPIQSIPLPPMKLEPIHIALPTNPTELLSPPRQSSTRIPVPKTSSALSRSSNTSSVNTATGGTTFAYTSSEDEGSLSGSWGKSRRSKTSSALKGSNSSTTTATMALTPPGLTHERRRSLKSASSRLTATSTSPKSSPKPSPKPSPKTSPRMKHSRSTSSSGGLSTSSPLSTSLPSTNYLQRKLSRNGQTPLTEPVPKLPTAITTSDYMTGSNYPASSTKTRQSNYTNGIGTSESSAVAVPSQQKGTGTTLNRTTSLHSTQATKGSNSGSDKKDRLRTVSLHGKIHPSAIQEPQFIMMGSNQTVTISSHPTVEQPKLQQPMAITSNDRDTPSAAAATTPPVRTAKSPHTALKYYAQYLTHYERNEILEFPHIYFIGPHAKKLQVSNDGQHQVYNHGYDDENGDYKIIRQDHLLYRYEIVDLLGQGSFGQVVKCYDHKTGATVAIKLIRNKKRFHAQALTEVKILQNLVDWDPEDKHHNIRMTDYFYFRQHLCVAFECMSMNLYEFIKKNNYQGFSVGLIRKFTIQILQSLTLLYKHRVVHCDLKPENILLKNPGRSTIKVIDFGSSCLETERVYTYIQSRFYRSPEVILGISYNMAIDMWSLGCILAELHTGIPLFPGESEQEQLGCIMEVMGLPDRYLIDQSSRKKLFFDSHGNARAVVNSKGKRRQPATKPLAHALRSNDLLFLDFIQGCLQWDPANRMTPMEAMDHDWIQQRTNNTNLASATTSAYQFPSNTNNNYQKLEEFKTKKRQHHHPPTTPKMTATAYYQSFRKHSVG